MTANVAIYLPHERPVTADRLRALAPGAEVRDDGGVFRKAANFEVAWADLAMQINQMPKGELTQHLRGFEGYVQARCQQHDPKVLDRIRSTQASYGVVIEPGPDPRADAVVRALAVGGILFRDDGVYAPDGKPLATPASRSTERMALDPYPLGPPPGVEDDPEGEEFSPPPADRVARRAVALGLVSLRGMVEEDPGDGTMLRELQKRGHAKGIAEELEAGERALLLSPQGRVPRQAAVDASWRLQGAAVLGWALGTFDLPAHDDPATVWEILEPLGLRSDPPPEAIRSPRLRPTDELERIANRLLGIHWRLVDFRLRPKAMDFAEFAKKCWFGSFDLTGVALRDGDLAIGGEAISRADPELIGLASSIARERHQAINWLLGQHWIYSEVDTST